MLIAREPIQLTFSVDPKNSYPSSFSNRDGIFSSIVRLFFTWVRKCQRNQHSSDDAKFFVLSNHALNIFRC